MDHDEATKLTLKIRKDILTVVYEHVSKLEENGNSIPMLAGAYLAGIAIMKAAGQAMGYEVVIDMPEPANIDPAEFN